MWLSSLGYPATLGFPAIKGIIIYIMHETVAAKLQTDRTTY
jgi:hypothetical protein